MDFLAQKAKTKKLPNFEILLNREALEHYLVLLVSVFAFKQSQNSKLLEHFSCSYTSYPHFYKNYKHKQEKSLQYAVRFLMQNICTPMTLSVFNSFCR